MNADCQITAVPLGEFRMGVDGFGASIVVKSKPIRFLEKEIVFVKPWSATQSNWWEEFVEFSADGRFVLIHGEFSIFVIDIEDPTLSLFKIQLGLPMEYGAKKHLFSARTFATLVERDAIIICNSRF